MAQFLSSLFSPPPALIPVLESIATVWGDTWWFVLPLVTGFLAWDAWHVYLAWRWAKRLDLRLLEIKIPKNVMKTPKAMEQIFAAAHAPFSYGYRWYQKHVQGMGEAWMSFELVGKAGESHFYLRVPRAFRNMMESAIYSQYPEAEITEVDDYLKGMPKLLPNKTLDVSGFEEVLRHPSYRPIRTYMMFEDPTEERRVDTMGALVEAISKLKGDEQLWFQVIVVPTGEDTQKEGQKAIAKLLHLEDAEEKKGGFFSKFDLGFGLSELLRAPFEHPGTRKKPKEEQKLMRFLIAPHDKELAEGIQKKIAKLSFNATLRFIYIERKDTPVKPEHMNSIHGFIRQFNTQDSNQLKPDKETTTAGYAVRGLFKKQRLQWRKRLIYDHYYHTVPAHHESVLNIEELATVFHFPIAAISTSELEKVESRKGTPPATLPVVE